MKRLLTAGIFSTILGIVGAGTANASIVSSGFLDEKLTEMTNATTLQLDTKANQSDLDFIGMQVDPEIWNDHLLSDDPWSSTNAAPIIEELFPNFVGSPYVPAPISPTLLSSLIEIDMPGIAGFTYKLLNGWTSTGGLTYLGVKDLNTKIGTLPSGKFPGFPESDIIFPKATYPTSLAELITTIYGNSETGTSGLLEGIFGGFLLSNGSPNEYVGLMPNYFLAKNADNLAKANAAKIGTLPTEIVIGNSNGSRGMFNSITKLQKVSLPKDYTLSDFIQDMYYGSFGDNAGLGKSPFYGLSDIIERVMYGGIIGEVDPDLAGKEYKGLIDLTLEADKIGPLPSGAFPGFPEYNSLFPWLNQPYSYPTSLAELITAIYGNSKTGYAGLLGAIIAGFPPFDADGDARIGLIPNRNLARNAKDLADANTAKIGTLPTAIPNNDSSWTRYGFVERTGTPIDLPDTIGGMFAMLFNEDGTYNGLSLRNIMVKILHGFDSSGRRVEGLENLTSAYKLTGDSPIVTAVKANTAAIEKIGTVPDGQTVAGMATTAKTTADSAIEKIGTLPTEYATVGAALSAIKGIAEEAKTAALAAIPDPKQEGSSGKFVLTVDIIGDNATYRWEKIDRESEPTTTE